jgi:hypothetical protein
MIATNIRSVRLFILTPNFHPVTMASLVLFLVILAVVDLAKGLSTECYTFAR